MSLCSILHKASWFAREQGDYAESEMMAQRSMSISTGVLGEEHPGTLTSMANLALTYGNQGRWKEAEELGVKVMETSRRVLGAEHPDTLTSIANLARTYFALERVQEAQGLLTSCVGALSWGRMS